MLGTGTGISFKYAYRTAIAVAATVILLPLTACKQRRTSQVQTAQSGQPQNEAKLTLDPPDPRFVAGDPRWAKFIIDLSDGDKIHFVDSNRFPFHYDFAKQNLPAFASIERRAFDSISLFPRSQRLVLGTVLVSVTSHALAIQLVGNEPYDTAAIVRHVRNVSNAILQPVGGIVPTFYMPSTEQADYAAAHSQELSRAGVQVLTSIMWSDGTQCYSPGWSIARLKYVKTSDIDRAYASGDLRDTDILLTEGVPAEVPHVSGIISMRPSTPSSHVALLSQSFHIPFAYVADELVRRMAQTLDGKDVAFWAGQATTSNRCEVRLRDMTGRMDAGLVDHVARLKAPARVAVKAIRRSGQYFIPAAGLTAEDVSIAGGKATNFSLLRAAIPDNSPVAYGLTFDAWLAFMGQPYGGQGSLADEIKRRLQPLGSPPNDPGQAGRVLEDVRKLIIEAPFPADAKQAILSEIRAKFSGLDPKRKLRFRSSTNVEDTGTFNGAGLYDSFSGCIADDLNPGNTGPSACDQAEPKRRGIFRAIQKDYASFYNLNAYVERQRHAIDESQVGMALAVHYSFPDAEEFANGVITAEYPASKVQIVSQAGAASVTNPDANSLPEIAGFEFNGESLAVSILQSAASSIDGKPVLGPKEKYAELKKLVDDVVAGWRQRNPGREAFTLDFEYKLGPQGKLMIKQVREVPMDAPRPAPVYLAKGSATVCSQQQIGRSQDVMGGQRLNMRLEYELNAGFVNDASFKGPLANIKLNLPGFEGVPRVIEGNITSFAGYRFGRSTNSEPESKQSFGIPPDDNGMTALTIISNIDETRDSRFQLPVMLAEDVRLEVRADYSRDQPMILGTHAAIHSDDYQQNDFGPTPAQNALAEVGEATWQTTRQDWSKLGPCSLPANQYAEPYENHQLQSPEGRVRVAASFWEPPFEYILMDNGTRPMLAWNRAEITGLASKSIVLTSMFSMSGLPQHHNAVEEYVFQPSADPGVDAATREELKRLKVRYIYVVKFADQVVLKLISDDGQVTKP